VRFQSRWWFNIHSDAYVNQMVDIVKAHRSSISGVWMYCGLNVDASGIFHYDQWDGIRLESCVSPIVNMGLTAGVSLNVNQDAIESGAALWAVDDIVAAAKKHRVTSIMVDYETHDDTTQAHAQKYANFLDQSLREDIERMKRVRMHRGLRHYWGVKVRGQHTCTTGRGVNIHAANPEVNK